MDAGRGEQWGDDPGWRLNWHVMILLLPQLQIPYLRRARGDPLVNLRSVWATYPIMLVVLGSVLLDLVPFRGDASTGGWVLGIGAYALVTQLVVPRIEQPLPCESDEKLAGAYRSRMFLRIAFATAAALFGFMAAFVTNASWVFLPCVLFAVPGLLRAAPTKAALLGDQDELTARGCDRSLVVALRTRPSDPN